MIYKIFLIPTNGYYRCFNNGTPFEEIITTGKGYTFETLKAAKLISDEIIAADNGFKQKDIQIHGFALTERVYKRADGEWCWV